MDKCLEGGGVNMYEVQIYIKNIKKTEDITLSQGGVVSQWGRGGVQLSLRTRESVNVWVGEWVNLLYWLIVTDL